jgi:hypothetical protein
MVARNCVFSRFAASASARGAFRFDEPRPLERQRALPREVHGECALLVVEGACSSERDAERADGMRLHRQGHHHVRVLADLGGEGVQLGKCRFQSPSHSRKSDSPVRDIRERRRRGDRESRPLSRDVGRQAIGAGNLHLAAVRRAPCDHRSHRAERRRGMRDDDGHDLAWGDRLGQRGGDGVQRHPMVAPPPLAR